MNSTSYKQTFENPPVGARPAPFWFWNDRLDPDRLVRQFDRLIEAGMGGAVLHARGGLDDEEYLDERWFHGVEAVVRRAEERGKIVWLYDETGWPSGSAGGRVLRKNPEYGCKHLVMTDAVLSPGSPIPGDGELVAAFRITRSDPNNGRYPRKARGNELLGAVTLLPDDIAYERVPLPLDEEKLAGARVLLFHSFLRGGTIDYFNPKATESFIRFTHEEYFRRFGSSFGATITHSFMDEAGTMSGPSSLPWTDAFAEEFRKRRGYDLTPHLPKLFFEAPGYESVRYDYWSLVAELFREGFGMVLDAWCSRHKIRYSGHYVFETSLKEATRQLGSTMPLYEYQGMPGIDTLGNDFYTHRFDPEAFGYYLVMMKQASSVVEQLGKPGLLSESHGVGGHAMLPEDMQAVDNFQMALGVTFISQHGVFYSMRAERKLDCPPAIGWQEPYWKFIKKHTDTLGRTGWLLSRGRRRSDVLLLHPQASMQASYRHPRNRLEYKAENYIFDADMPFELLDKHITLFSVALLDAQIDFEYGDEEIMAKHARVEGSRLHIGRQSYRLFVLPPLINIRATTLALLRAFAENGGLVFLVGSAPRLVDGRPSDEAARFFADHARRIADGVDLFDYRAAVEELSSHGARAMTISDEEGRDVPAVKVHRRIWEDREIVYVANVSRAPLAAKVRFVPEATGTLEEWDVATGRTRPLAGVTAGEELALTLDWAAKEARAFVTVPEREKIAAPVPLAERKRIRPDWRGERTAPNVLLLDECLLCDDDGTTRRYSIAEAREVLAEKIRAKGGPSFLSASFPFTVSAAHPPAGENRLAVEFADRPRALLNEHPLALDVLGWEMDPANEVIACPALAPAENVLRVEGVYKSGAGLDSPWLLGDFDVSSEDNVAFRVEEASPFIPLGPWPKIGLPFYAGTVVYRAQVEPADLAEAEKVTLFLPGLKGCAQVRVNGRVVDEILWPPYECDLTHFVTAGRNVIEIEVANTLRNLLGAHFNPDEETKTGAAISTYAGKAGQPKIFVDYGLLEAPEIVVSSRAAQE